jgi:DNA-binding XRE family transcriptional regulator
LLDKKGALVERFPDNLFRILGLHLLTAREAAKILGISESALGKWGTGARRPSFDAALQVSEFFGLDANRLAQAKFEDLLQRELADPDRFRAVEARIHSGRTGLKAVEAMEAGEVVDVTTGEPVNHRTER